MTLCGLGLSKIKKMSTLTVGTTITAHGTPLYMAPESLHQKTSSTKSDTYGFGATMYGVIFENYMWDPDEDANIQTGGTDSLKRKMDNEKIPYKLQLRGNHNAYPVTVKCVQFYYEKKTPKVDTHVR